MHYDPIKNVFAGLIRRSILLRRAFYWALGLLFLREWYVKRALRMLLRPEDQKSIFDAGSGFGQYSYFLSKRFPQTTVYAVDVKEDQIADCRRFFSSAQLHRVRFEVEDLTVPTHTEEFDLILSVDVMEHIADDVGVLRNFHHALRPGGVVLINTPSRGTGQTAVALTKDDSFIGEHVRYGYTPAEIREKLSIAGLTTESIRFTYGRWGACGWRLAIKIPMLASSVSRIFLLFLPLYYTVALPFALLFMYLDYSAQPLQDGGGLLVVARRP